MGKRVYSYLDNNRNFSVIFFPEYIRFTLGGTEHTTLSIREARELAKGILEECPDPSILEDNLAAIM